MKGLILSTYIRFMTIVDYFRIKIPLNDCCYRESRKIKNKLDRYYNDIIQDMRVDNERNTRKLLDRLYDEHKKEKQEIVKEFEEKILELYSVIEEKEQTIKNNQKAYTYINEMLPKMQMLTEHNAMLVEMEKMRIVKKKQKYDYVADGFDGLNEYWTKKFPEIKKLMGL